MGVTESGLVIRQSDLASFSYCAMRQKYDRTAAAAGRQPERLSATIAGTVAHYALEIMQRAVHEGREDALKVGLATFEHYWQPENTGQISEGPPTIWIARQTWGGVLAQMRTALTQAHEWMVKSKDILLATEYTFDLPIEVDGEIHTLHGTIDRLAIRMKDRMPVLSVDDWKTGVKPDHLQYAMQWSVYSWASTQLGFWNDFLETPGFDEVDRRVSSRGVSLYESTEQPLAERWGRWLAVRNGEFKPVDCGQRTEQHYKRMRLAISQYVRAIRADVAPLTTDTKKCAYCAWRNICGDAPLPDPQEGIDDEYRY